MKILNNFKGWQQHRTFQQEVGKLFFEDLSIRPDPRRIAEFIGRGLTEQMVLDAAKSRKLPIPKMDVALKEHAGVVPFLQRLSDRLAQDHSGATLLFAARDASIMYDDFAIRYPNLRSHLMPASTELWYGDSMKDNKLAARFLGAYGLSESAANSDESFTVVDTGIHGSIGIRIDKRFNELYGTSLLKAGRLCIKLVSKAGRGPATEIMEFEGGKDVFDETVFPRTAPMIARELAKQSEWSSTAPLMVALQTMPQYFGAYEKLQEIQGKVIALPDLTEQHWNDSIDYIGSTIGAMNASIVNPAAAAVFQFRTVSHALTAMAAPNILDPQPQTVML